ncbi:hypothetical protein [[Erwinia] mediterraneensis]|uniref:hypothetical protein n=1 Tax=[Erwinia] mediterraneensis TaxID=2161819 RepID=UPI001030420B|nr:hypothetical protein [[Erwinia] mediterraneensis]
MRPFYDNIKLHDEVLDAVEESIIAVNLPESQNDRNSALTLQAHQAHWTQQQEAVRQLEARHSAW